jgi:hypothetical protein
MQGPCRATTIEPKRCATGEIRDRAMNLAASPLHFLTCSTDSDAERQQLRQKIGISVAPIKMSSTRPSAA